MSKKRSKAKQRAQEPTKVQPQPLERRRCVSVKQLRAQARELVRASSAKAIGY